MRRQYLVWPSQQTMNNTPDWLRPQVGKQEASPYDMLVDLVPWYALQLFFFSSSSPSPVLLLTPLTGPKCANCSTSIVKNTTSYTLSV